MKVERRSLIASCCVVGFAIWIAMGIVAVQAQSSASSSQQPASSTQDVPDAPSAVRASPSTFSAWILSNDRVGQVLSPPRVASDGHDEPVAFPVDPSDTTTGRTHPAFVPQAAPRNQINPRDDLFKI